MNLTPMKEDLPVLLMVTGYVEKSTMENMCCISCKHMFGSLELESCFVYQVSDYQLQCWCPYYMLDDYDHRNTVQTAVCLF